MDQYNILILVGVLVSMIGIGYILGLVGNTGGPIFMVIILAVFQLPVKTAIGTGLLASLIAGIIAFAAHRRMNNVHYPFALLTGIAGAVGASVGASISLNVSDEKLKNILGVVILSVAVIGLTKTLLKKPSKTKAECDLDETKNKLKPNINFNGKAKSISCFLGLSVGSACGILGLSGASPLSVLFRTLLDYPMRICIGSAYLAATIISLSGFAHYAVKGQVDLVYGLVLSLGTGAGIYLSTKTIKIIADKQLTIVVLIFTVIMATFTFFI